VLAAVVVAALIHALDPAPIVELWRLRRDVVVALSAAIAVLAFGVLNGMLIAIVLSLAALLRRFATPHVARLGRLGTSHDYVDIQRHPEAVAPSDVVIWRAAEPLFFANAERVLTAITTGSGDCRLVIVSLEESADLDSTALEALIEFDASAAKRGVRVQLARAHDRVRDLLTRAGADELAARTSFSVDDAVDAVRGTAAP
jgi:MFS superfamily sulfate permease-like transporter